MTSTSFSTGYFDRVSSKVIQPPGGQTADIFGSREDKTYSSASSQAGSDVASVRMQTDAEKLKVAAANQQQHQHQHQQQQQQQQQQAQSLQSGQISPVSSIGASSNAASSLADDFKPTTDLPSIHHQKLIQAAAMQNVDAVNRTPKKTIPTIRRNPITGEVYENPSGQQMPVRVRQPPGGKSSGIF